MFILLIICGIVCAISFFTTLARFVAKITGFLFGFKAPGGVFLPTLTMLASGAGFIVLFVTIFE